MAWEWFAPTISGIIGAGGLIFGWSTSKQSWRQTKRLAQENNEHAVRMAEEATQQAVKLEEVRGALASRERHRDKLESFYLEVSTVVIRAGDHINDASSAVNDGQAFDLQPEEKLTQARAVANLYFPSNVVERFNAWYDQLSKAQYAVARHADVLQRGRGDTDDKARFAWRRQAREALFVEADVREELMSALRAQIAKLRES